MKLFNRIPTPTAVIMVARDRRATTKRPAPKMDQGEHEEAVWFHTGVTAPPGKRMGHAGPSSGGKGTAQEKNGVMEACGIKVTRIRAEMGQIGSSRSSSMERLAGRPAALRRVFSRTRPRGIRHSRR